MIVVLALPLFDAFWVIVDRLRLRKNPMQGDYSHLHYRLMALGWNRHEVRRSIWLYSIVMMVLMLLQGTDKMGKLIVFMMCFVLFFGLNVYLFWIKKLPSVYKPEVKKDNNDE
jgi:heme O synthase-like polyprenyltransferase